MIVPIFLIKFRHGPVGQVSEGSLETILVSCARLLVRWFGVLVCWYPQKGLPSHSVRVPASRGPEAVGERQWCAPNAQRKQPDLQEGCFKATLPCRDVQVCSPGKTQGNGVSGFPMRFGPLHWRVDKK